MALPNKVGFLRITFLLVGGIVASANYGYGEIAADRTTMPEKFQGAPGLIKGGFMIKGSRERFEKANTLDLESYKTSLQVNPGEVSLQQISNPKPNEQLSIKFVVTNGSDRGAFLFFPTSQRFEAILRDGSGKVVYTWSEDYEFSPEVGYSFLNPSERLNYQLSIPLQALRGKFSEGQLLLSASLVNYPRLRAETPIEIVP